MDETRLIIAYTFLFIGIVIAAYFNYFNGGNNTTTNAA